MKFVTMEPGHHVTLGPAVILYRGQDRATGPFHTLATFHQIKKLEHSEGYGLFIGGQALTGKAKGVVGLRVNHNLDLHVEGFAVHQ